MSSSLVAITVNSLAGNVTRSFFRSGIFRDKADLGLCDGCSVPLNDTVGANGFEASNRVCLLPGDDVGRPPAKGSIVSAMIAFVVCGSNATGGYQQECRVLKLRVCECVCECVCVG
eukprot:m.80174 g.80174  ORF g.80174 m.80174 type:complete len:116 (-) comp12595_c0_seq1:760-1107(-)